MITFIIPLKSKQSSHSWETVCQLFERCLRSIDQQTDSNFKIIVVYHDKPNISFQPRNIHYVQVDFPTPDDTIRNKRHDKSKKTIVGLMYARQFNPDYAMIVDYDDCISSNIVKFVNNNIGINGWYLNSGYVYQEDSSLIYYRKMHFYRWCGTCSIIKFDVLPLPNEENLYPDHIVNYYSSENHRNIVQIMKSQKIPLTPLPFAGAIYIIGNGENIYQKGFSTLHNANQGNFLFFLKEVFKFRILTPSIRKRFGLYQLANP